MKNLSSKIKILSGSEKEEFEMAFMDRANDRYWCQMHGISKEEYATLPSSAIKKIAEETYKELYKN